MIRHNRDTYINLVLNIYIFYFIFYILLLNIYFHIFVKYISILVTK